MKISEVSTPERPADGSSRRGSAAIRASCSIFTAAAASSARRARTAISLRRSRAPPARSALLPRLPPGARASVSGGAGRRDRRATGGCSGRSIAPGTRSCWPAIRRAAASRSPRWSRLRRDSPAAAPAGVCISPWVDLTCSGASYDEGRERSDRHARHHHGTGGGLCCGSGGDRKLRSPRRLYADLRDLPPLLVQVGERGGAARRRARSRRARARGGRRRHGRGMAGDDPRLALVPADARTRPTRPSRSSGNSCGPASAEAGLAAGREIECPRCSAVPLASRLPDATALSGRDPASVLDGRCSLVLAALAWGTRAALPMARRHGGHGHGDGADGCRGSSPAWRPGPS